MKLSLPSDCTLDLNQPEEDFNNIITTIAYYAGQNYNILLQKTIENEEPVQVSAPTPPTAPLDFFQRIQYEIELEHYLSRRKQLEISLKLTFALIIDHCSPLLCNKLSKAQEWEEIQQQSDLLGLLALIKATIFELPVPEAAKAAATPSLSNDGIIPITNDTKAPAEEAITKATETADLPDPHLRHDITNNITVPSLKPDLPKVQNQCLVHRSVLEYDWPLQSNVTGLAIVFGSVPTFLLPYIRSPVSLAYKTRLFARIAYFDRQHARKPSLTHAIHHSSLNISYLAHAPKYRLIHT